MLQSLTSTLRILAKRWSASKAAIKLLDSYLEQLTAEFAALTGARQAEFLPLSWPALDEAEVRIERAKQRLGVKKVDRVAVSPALAALRARLLAFQTSPMGAVFPNSAGNVYTADGFATMWQKLMVAAIEAGPREGAVQLSRTAGVLRDTAQGRDGRTAGHARQSDYNERRSTRVQRSDGVTRFRSESEDLPAS